MVQLDLDRFVSKFDNRALFGSQCVGARYVFKHHGGNVRTMRSFAFFIAIALLTTPAISEEAAGCVLQVDDVSYVKGECSVERMENGGFVLSGENGDYFAYVFPDGQSYWNEEKGAGHAHTSLGELLQSGNCWTNEAASVCFTPLQSAEPVWTFSEYEEDWGPTCEASKRVGFGKVGLLAAKEGDLVLFVSAADLPTKAFASSWQIDSKEVHLLIGEKDDYFGWHMFDLQDASLVYEMAKGNGLTVTVANYSPMIVTLGENARDAISSFLACRNYPAPD